MLYEYILNNYINGEPIFISELPGNSLNYISQEMKKLVDEGKIERLYNGVYYLPYTTILGTKGRPSVKKYIDKKFLNIDGKTSGYITGIQLANLYGFTSQNPSSLEICSNGATTKQRKIEFDGTKIIIYKPPVKINKENVSALEFLDLLSCIDKYSGLSGDELKMKLKDFVKKLNVDFNEVKKYISLYPDKTYKNIYEGGLMNELV